MKRVLLTGASGFIGRHAVKPLMERDYEVHAVSSRLIDPGTTGVYWHEVDLLEANQIPILLARIQPTHLLHFAWCTTPGKYMTSLDNLRWVQSSMNLAKEFTRHGGQRVVMAGTCAEYDWRNGYCTEGKTPLIPAQLYGVCKHALQMILHEFADQTGISAAWGRIFFLFGPYEKAERLIPSVISSLLRNEPIRCGNANQIRDFLFVQDVADAFVALLESEVTGPVNIASGCSISIKDIIHKIANKLNREDKVRLAAFCGATHEPHQVVADVDRLRNVVGWFPKYDFEKGLDLTLLWWKRNIAERDYETFQ
jgi:nucleoside-diphosphate-sugar epimerase